MPSKFIRVNDYPVSAGVRPRAVTEVRANIETDQVVVGIGLRMKPGNVTTLRVRGKRLNPSTGKLEGPVLERRAGTAPGHQLEIEIGDLEILSSESVCLGMFYARADPGNITTLHLWTSEITENGTLAPPRLSSDHMYGSDPRHPVEVQISPNDNPLPPGYIVIAVGLRANPGTITTIRAEYGYLVPRA